MKYYATILFALAIGLQVSPTHAQQSPCGERTIKLCRTEEGEANPICTILRQDKGETPDSVVDFLSKVGPLSEPVRQDLICARLMGRKIVRGVASRVIAGQSRNFYRFETPSASYKSPNRWFLALNDSQRYADLLALHEKLATLNKSVSPEIRFDFSGTITFVHGDYDYNGKLRFFEIQAHSVDLSEIHTPHATGGLGVQIEALNTLLNSAYEEYMSIGLEPEAREIPVLVDVAHLQGTTTVVLQFSEEPRYKVVQELPGEIQVRMMGDRLAPPSAQPRLSGPLVQGVTITSDRLRIYLAPEAQTSSYVLERPFRIVFDVKPRMSDLPP